MKIEINLDKLPEPCEVRAGNVYPVKGGRGAARGHMMVVIAITDYIDFEGSKVLLLIVDKIGKPIGVTHYGIHYFADKMPIAFADGVDDIEFTIRSI